ncbi:MAG: LEA type 2 family protein [Gemmatimonadota bacterium]
MRGRVLVGVMAWVGLVTACVPKVEQPEVWLGAVRLASIGLSGGVVDVHLSVYNPNTFELRASGLTYDVDLRGPGGDGWADFTEGRLERDLEVAPRDTALVVIPVEFEYRGLGRAVRSLLDRGSFDYRVSGLVALAGPIRRDFRYRHGGAVTPSGVR